MLVWVAWLKYKTFSEMKLELVSLECSNKKAKKLTHHYYSLLLTHYSLLITYLIIRI